MDWLNNTAEGKKEKASASRNTKQQKQNGKGDRKRKAVGNNNKSWQKKLKAKMKTDKGLADVMSMLAEQEKSNVSFAAALTSAATSNQQASQSNANNTANVSALQQICPATTIKLNTILKNGNGNKK